MGRQIRKCIVVVRATLEKSMGEPPSNLVYRCEAVSPVEIEVASHRVRYFNEKTNDDE